MSLIPFVENYGAFRTISAIKLKLFELIKIHRKRLYNFISYNRAYEYKSTMNLNNYIY